MAPAFQDVQMAPTHKRRRQPDTTVSPTREEHGPSRTRRRLPSSEPAERCGKFTPARVGKDIDELAVRRGKAGVGTLEHSR
jgi:hypothetical protein